MEVERTDWPALPTGNRTNEKGRKFEYYPPAKLSHARRIFGPTHFIVMTVILFIAHCNFLEFYANESVAGLKVSTMQFVIFGDSCLRRNDVR